MPVRQALALAAALVIVLPWSARAPAADRPLAVGSRAPEIALSDQHGQPFKLSEALGKQRFVVVAFYVKAFTGG